MISFSIFVVAVAVYLVGLIAEAIGLNSYLLCIPKGGGWLKMAWSHLSFGKDRPNGMVLKSFGHYLACGTCSTFCMISLK
jgi:hypothetical protein